VIEKWQAAAQVRNDNVHPLGQSNLSRIAVEKLDAIRKPIRTGQVEGMMHDLF